MKLVFVALMALVPRLVIGQASDKRYGDYLYVSNKDAMTDEDRSFVYTVRGTGSDGMKSLAWKCLEDGLNVIVSTSYLAGDSDDEVRVMYRFAPNPPSREAYWAGFSGNDSWWMPMNIVPDFTKEAIQKEEVVIRVTDPFDGETLTKTFSLRGLRDSLRNLSCAAAYFR